MITDETQEDPGIGNVTAVQARLAAIEARLAALEARLAMPPCIEPAVLAARLGLTPMQCRVAVALADGMTVPQIAEAMGRKVNTVRYSVKEIKNRLGISTQAQVVREVFLAAWKAGGNGRH